MKRHILHEIPGRAEFTVGPAKPDPMARPGIRQ
jgi:hypothetical protein